MLKLSAAESEYLTKSLARQIAGEVLFDPYHSALYSTDASLYQIQPLGVVIPRNTADVVAATRWAAENAVQIIPRGGGTSLSGQSIGPGIVIDFSKFMNQILELDPQSRTARVQPGVVLDQLNTAVARHKLQFGPDVSTSSRANVGGMIGNNSAGSRSILHGKTVDHVIEMEAVLADGTVARFGPRTPAEWIELQKRSGLEGNIHRQVPRISAAHRDEVLARFPRILRRVSGYNLDEFIPECRDWFAPPPSVARLRQVEAERYPGAALNISRLICGAEGTLATVTEALVHLVPLPAERAIAVLHFDSLAHSVAILGTILSCAPSAVEFFDKMILDLAAESLEYRNYLDFVVGRPESLILVEFSADSAERVRGQMDELASKLRGAPGLTHILPAYEPKLRDHIWACRKAALPLLMGIPGLRKPIAFVEDTAVDPPRLPEFVRRFRTILLDEGTDGAFYGHASVGCMHIRPLIDASSRDDLERMRRILDKVSDLVLEFGGSMSGEHGDGLARSFLNEKLFGPQLYQAFKEVKRAFDPQGILNRGKVVDGPSPVENLRQGPGYKTLDIVTELDFSNQGGLARAVELCNGSGLCRKTQTGTMCPSFMVTGDEEHSTRGRANALRLVLSGALPPSELTGQKLYNTFDLCLQCKGCKAECPSNVDVARMKVEFLHHYYQEHGTPLSVRAMGHVATLNRLGSKFAPLANALANMPGAGWLQEKLLGVDRRRPMPRFASESFQQWFAARVRSNNASRGPIVLLDDCLTSYCEPQVNRAAVRVLEAAGYEVHLAGLPCCGRAMISKGLVPEAKQLAQENIERLLPWAERGVPIVGCEPSCLLTLVDDYLDLAPGNAARQVAATARLIDSHLIEAGIALPLAPGDARLLLHGHCHQKALVGAQHTKALLQTAPGVEARLIDSGCCGMAGSFGYEHYDISMQIGERVLFPAVRDHGQQPVVAPGFSCRHQIAHGTGTQAMHPIEFLATRLIERDTAAPDNNP
jgi:FAD/FMN-containing dehydrogenase/Fe-S oxidoreductase